MTQRIPEYNISITRGDDFTLAFTLKDSTDTAINLTGYTGVLQLKRDEKQSNIDQSYTATLGGSAGTFSAAISDTFTSANDGRFYYQAKITSGGGITTTKLKGIITLIP